MNKFLIVIVSVIITLTMAHTAFAADRFWLGTTSTDSAVAANWSASSGGAGGASVPGTGDTVTFDGNGDYACTVTANWTHGGFTTVVGYTKKLDLATFNLIGDDGVNVTLDQGGEFDCGTGSHSITNGNFDNLDVGTWTWGTSTWTLNGTGNIVSSTTNDFYDLTIASGASITATTNIQTANDTIVNGTISVNGATAAYLGGNGTVVIGDGGRITGAGQWIMSSINTGEGVTSFHAGGTVDITTTRIQNPLVAGTFVPGVYDSKVIVDSTDGTNRTLVLDAAGAYTFSSLEFQTNSTGNLTLANNTNGPASITITGDLTIDLNSTGDITISNSGQSVDWDIQGDVIDQITGGGTFTYTAGTGTFTASGTADQAWNFNGETIEPLSISKATSGDLTLVDTVVQIADVDMAAGDLVITGSTITSSADAKAITGAFDIGAAGNDVNMGSATWTLTDCALDYDDIGTLTATSAAVVFAGTCTVQASGVLGSTTIAASGTTTVLAVGGNFSVTGAIINGTLSIETGKQLVMDAAGDVVLNTGGRITGAGWCMLNRPTATHGLTVHDGTIDVAVFRVFRPSAGAVVVPGTFSCTDRFKVENTSGSDFKLELNGSYIFNCDFEVENTGAGDMEIKNVTNSPNLTFQKDVIWDEQAGSITWTKGGGLITFAAANAQDADFGAATIEDIDVDKTNVTDVLTFSGGWTSDSFLVTKGTVDFGGQTVETSGNFTIGIAGQVTPATLAGSTWTIGGDFYARGESGDLITLNPSSAWTLTVTGSAAADYVNVDYSDASNGSIIYSTSNSTDGGHNTNWDFVPKLKLEGLKLEGIKFS